MGAKYNQNVSYLKRKTQEKTENDPRCTKNKLPIKNESIPAISLLKASRIQQPLDVLSEGRQQPVETGTAFITVKYCSSTSQSFKF